MDMDQLQQIEVEEAVAFSFRPDSKTISCRGTAAAVDRALERIADRRDEIAGLLRERQGIPDDEKIVVERQIAFGIPSLEIQRANYVRWFKARPMVY